MARPLDPIVWVVREPGGERAISEHPTLTQASTHAEKLLRGSLAGQYRRALLVEAHQFGAVERHDFSRPSYKKAIL